MGFGGGGGGGATYVPPPTPVYEAPDTPKVQTAKPVTEAATAARQAQKDKAAKAAGLQGSILTSPLSASGSGKQKSLLGQ